jgi:ElaB/YqjD/DUF883 family membrane-anchored ribosome-binding protein
MSCRHDSGRYGKSREEAEREVDDWQMSGDPEPPDFAMERSGYMARTDSEEMTSADIEILKADIQKLRDDLGDMLGSIGSYSKERLADTRDRLMAAVEDLEGKAYDRLQGTARTVRDRGHRAVDASRGAVSRSR